MITVVLSNDDVVEISNQGELDLVSDQVTLDFEEFHNPYARYDVAVMNEVEEALDNGIIGFNSGARFLSRHSSEYIKQNPVNKEDTLPF